MPRLRLLPDVTVVYTDQQAAEVLQYLMNRGGAIAIDTETNGRDKLRSRVLCWSMATESARYFIPWEYLEFFYPLFKRRDIRWYLANAKFDLHMLANMGVHLEGEVHDIIVADAMEDDTRAHGLKEQARYAYDVSWGDFKDLFLKPEYVSQELGLDRKAFTQFKLMDVGEKLLFVYAENPVIVHNYASCDAFFTYMRGEDLRTRLGLIPCATDMVEGISTLYDYFHAIEVPFTKVLWKMERTGVPIDMERVNKIDIPMREGIRAQLEQIHVMIGPSFNPMSTDELRDLLFSKQGYNLKPVKFTSGKNPKPSTDVDDLKMLQSRVKDQKIYDVLEAILKYRNLTKLHGTFVKGIQKHLGPDGRIHCSLNQTGARTGRLSASDPNLQNIPIRNDKFGIRSIFCAPEGKDLLGCDYPQIQPRLAAVFAGEEKLMEDIRAGFDIHGANAANMYGPKDPRATFEAINAAKEIKESKSRPLTDVEKILLKYRDGAKTVGLGVLFGEGKWKMAHQLKITVEEAGELIDTFFQTYPGIKQLIKDTHESCRRNEYGYTMLGRIRRLWRINNNFNYGVVAAEERQGFNFLIQGSEIELMKCAMLQIDADKRWQELGGELALTIHDELLSFAPKATSAEALEVKQEIMANPLNWGPVQIQLPIPVRPDGGRGYAWPDVH